MKTRFEKLMAYLPLISNRTKLLCSSILVAFAVLLTCIRAGSTDAKVCLLAMIFSFGGDVALNCMPLKKRPHWLLYLGAGFFMIAHLVYASAYYLLIKDAGKLYLNFGAIMACIFMIAIFSSTVVFAIYSKSKPKNMTIFVFTIYTIVIGINFVTIYSYSWNFGAVSFVGALSFLISDFIIGIETVFKVKSDILRKLVWIFYPIGQILILACR